MNKQGLVFFYTLMLGTIIIVLGIAFAYPIKQIMDDKRTELSCAAPASDYDQALCWIFDILKPTIPATIIFVGVAVLLARRFIS